MREVSVRGDPLARCSEASMPTTGYTRNGVCSTHKGDEGSHHVCVRNLRDSGFCEVTGQTNWCSTKQDWCVCEWAFDRAIRRVGCDAFNVKCDATNMRALEHYDRTGRMDAAACIRRKCHS